MHLLALELQSKEMGLRYFREQPSENMKLSSETLTVWISQKSLPMAISVTFQQWGLQYEQHILHYVSAVNFHKENTVIKTSLKKIQPLVLEKCKFETPEKSVILALVSQRLPISFPLQRTNLRVCVL